jgi:putative redox protein
MQSVTSKLVSGTNYQVESTSGSFTMVCDQPTTVSGTDKGPNPKAFLLAAIGACTVQTLKMVAPRRKWDLQEITVTVTFDEVDDPKNPGTKIAQIEEKIEVKGNLTPAELAAIEQTAGKCPVLKLVEGPKQVLKKAIKV